MIDVHGHIGHFKGYDLSEATLLRNLAAGGVELALVSNLDGAAVPGKTRDLDETAVNRTMAECVGRNSDRIRGLLWGRPDRSDATALAPFFGEELDPTPNTGGWTRRVFVGIKLHPAMNAFAADAEEVDPYLEVAEEAGFPVVFHSDTRVDEASADRILAAAVRHPRAPVILYHMGFHGPHGPVIRKTAQALEAGAENVFLETAQADPASVLEAISTLGARRVLFGTDVSYYGSDHYAHYRPTLEALERFLEPTERERVLRGNAIELFRLREETGSGGVGSSEKEDS